MKVHIVDSDFARALLRLQALVLTLGENRHAAWWKCDFISATGLSFLNRIYPRTPFAVAVRSSAQAARLVHDNATGIKGVFHLFRLPRPFELHSLPMSAIRGVDLTAQGDLAQELTPHLAERVWLLNELRTLAGEVHIHASPGPLRIAEGREVKAAELLRRLAAVYENAFSRNLKTFPYWTATLK